MHVRQAVAPHIKSVCVHARQKEMQIHQQSTTELTGFLRELNLLIHWLIVNDQREWNSRDNSICGRLSCSNIEFGSKCPHMISFTHRELGLVFKLGLIR